MSVQRPAGIANVIDGAEHAVRGPEPRLWRNVGDVGAGRCRGNGHADSVEQHRRDREVLRPAADAHAGAAGFRKGERRWLWLPELGWRGGYPFALSLMVAITFVGFRYFKSKDWL